MSVGGAGHRIPQCNHLTLFGSADSVVEFPPHRKFLCWMLQKFPVRSCFTVCWLIFCPASPALKALREDRYHWVRATPLFFLEENVTVRFLLRELPDIRELSDFRRSLISKLLIRRPKTALVPRLCPCPAREKHTSPRSTVPQVRLFVVERSQLNRIIYVVRFHFVYTILVSLT